MLNENTVKDAWRILEEIEKKDREISIQFKLIAVLGSQTIIQIARIESLGALLVNLETTK